MAETTIQKCPKCGAEHIYYPRYMKPWKTCARITNITKDGIITKCSTLLPSPKVEEKTSGRKCGKCGGTGHNKLTCPN